MDREANQAFLELPGGQETLHQKVSYPSDPPWIGGPPGVGGPPWVGDPP